MRSVTAPTPDDAREAACPRCGYDQRGVIATWNEKGACPLQGVCAECGLEFTWDEVLRPERITPQWCVEFVPRRRLIPLASFKTLARSFWPWAFWKRMKMAFAVRWLRLACYLLMLLTPLLVGYVLAQSAVAVIVLRRLQQDNINWQTKQVPAMILRLQAGPLPSRLVGPTLPSMRIADAVLRQQAQQRMLANLQQQLKMPATIEHSYPAAITEAVLFPLSHDSWGKVTFPNTSPQGAYLGVVTNPYPAPPTVLWSTLFNPPAGGYGREFWYEVSPGLGAVAMWSMFLLAPLPLSLALLPVTRRRAKVRWAHIARVAIYSLFIPIVLVELILGVWVITALGWPTARVLDPEQLVVPAGLGMPLMIACWWSAAIKRYLRMPHALAVTLVMGVLCVLVVGSAVFWIGMALSSH